jgi:hypothetical protein
LLKSYIAISPRNHFIKNGKQDFLTAMQQLPGGDEGKSASCTHVVAGAARTGRRGDLAARC